MLHVQLPLSMPSTLTADFTPLRNEFRIPQLQEFKWDFNPRPGRLQFGESSQGTVKGAAGLSAKYPAPARGDSPRYDHTARAKSTNYTESMHGHSEASLNGSGVRYNPTPQFASNGPAYPNTQTMRVHARQNSKTQPFYQNYYSARKHPSPIIKREHPSERDQSARRRASEDGNTIASYLQIPPSINNSKGSLPEFAAQITCLFWFESSQTLDDALDVRLSGTVPSPLEKEAMPTTGFRKWVTTILSMTQVSQNVILLALMFIYRLKKLNPTVKGKIGSEFRLLTVALMLGNKFLDDNTYTNKTWAEVSGISVQEIHVMEVEFLSNMRYSLYASEEEWNAWHVKLGRFADYFDRAVQAPMELSSRTLASPASLLHRTPDLPSPPVSEHMSPSFARPLPGTPGSIGLHTLPPPLKAPLTLSHQNFSGPQLASNHMAFHSPTADGSGPWSRNEGAIAGASHADWPRKRSVEENSQEPPAKRMSYCPSSASSATMTPNTLQDSNSPVPRLPMPNIPSGLQHGIGQQLPLPNARAMANVYPGPGRVLPSLQPSQHFHPRSSSTTSSPVYEPPHRPSPYGHQASGSSSPTHYQFPLQPHTPAGLSPSGMPMPRKSPYKPIRGVNTLLVPPPSTSVHHAPHQLSYEQMHYQPLGQPASQRRAGVLPSLPFDTWSQAHHMQHYLPQPHFPPSN